MIDDDILNQLSSNPYIAFLQYEQNIRRSRDEMLSVAHDTTVEKNIYRDYVGHLKAFHDIYKLDFELSWTAPEADSSFEKWRNKLERTIEEIRIRYRLSLKQSGKLVLEEMRALEGKKFSPEVKQEIHGHINKIRNIISNLTMDDKKRDVLLAKLNKFADEVDRSRTKLEAFTDFFLATTKAVGEGAENLEPVVKIVERIGGILGKESDDMKALPAPETPKLPPPRPPIKFIKS